MRDTVESYSAETNTWRPLAKLSVKRSSVGVAFLNGFLYAVGTSTRDMQREKG